MTKDIEQDDTRDRLQGMAARILEEVIQADMSMHDAQLKAWRWFAEHRPKGEYVNSDIDDGFASQLYLALNELKINFSVRPVPNNFFTRIKTAWRILSGRKHGILKGAQVYDVCSANDPNAIALQISVTRFKDGTVKAEYSPADQITSDLLC